LQSYLIEDSGELIPEQQFDVRRGDVLYNQYHIIGDSLMIYRKVPNSVEKINLLTNEVTGSIDLDVKSTSDGSLHPNYGVMAANNESIAYVYTNQNQIDIYNLSDMSLKVRLRGKGYVSNAAPSMNSEVFYFDVCATDKYFYAYRMKRDIGNESYEYFIEVFDWDGNSVKKIHLPMRIMIFTIANDDNTMYGYSEWQDDKILKFDSR
jgi:hypothetical protein